MKLPLQFRDRLQALGDDWANQILSSMEIPKDQGYFINSLVSDSSHPHKSQCTALLGKPVAGIQDTWWVPHAARGQLIEHPATQAGHWYPLNPSSRLPVLALSPEPGEEVLDLAAAPGGKSIQMAAVMANEGRLAVVEPVKGRFHRLRANLERCGVTISQAYLMDGRQVGRKVPERFDRVLLDAPCSSEARFLAGDEQTFAHWTPRKIRETSAKQKGLILSAFDALKPGGILVYCTCAFAPEENELVVHYLLRKRDQAELIPLERRLPNIYPGLTQYGGRKFSTTLKYSQRVMPDRLFDGFFLAKIHKGFG